MRSENFSGSVGPQSDEGFGGNLLNPEDDKSLILNVLVLLLLLSFLAWRYLRTGEIRRILRHALIWLGIFLAVTIAHSFRFELGQIRDRILANLIPGRSFKNETGAMSFQLSPDGHFYIQARANGVEVRFLADTGASDIVLSPEAGKSIGVNPDKLSYSRIYNTANGMGRGASVVLKELKVGDFCLNNISAAVNGSPMSISLMGMSFFNRLKSYRVKDGILTIYYDP